MWIHKTIYNEKGYYSSFPSISSDGYNLFLTFRRAGYLSCERALKGLITHHDNDSEACFTKINIDGEILEDLKFFKNDFGVNDPGISVLKNGDLFLR